MELFEMGCIRWFGMLGEIDRSWHYFEEDTWEAASRAAHDAAEKKIIDKSFYSDWNARMKAIRDENWHAYEHMDVTKRSSIDDERRAITKEIRNVAGMAAIEAAWYDVGAVDAVEDAVGDAILMTSLILSPAGTFDENSIDHMAARMEVWKRGYALQCEIDGVFYVYGMKKTTCKELPKSQSAASKSRFSWNRLRGRS